MEPPFREGNLGRTLFVSPTVIGYIVLPQIRMSKSPRTSECHWVFKEVTQVKRGHQVGPRPPWLVPVSDEEMRAHTCRQRPREDKASEALLTLSSGLWPPERRGDVSIKPPSPRSPAICCGTNQDALSTWRSVTRVFSKYFYARYMAGHQGEQQSPYTQGT